MNNLDHQKIGVIGTGYVGLVLSACLAESGIHVYCLDEDELKIGKINSGQLPIHEPGLPRLFEQYKERMTFTENIESIVDNCKIIFICVGTPLTEDQTLCLKSVYRALNRISTLSREDKIVVLKSTLPPGTTRELQKFVINDSKNRIELVVNPEFLRQGSAIEDFKSPDRIVIGGSTESSTNSIVSLYENMNFDREKIFTVSPTSAELIKFAANSFLALKISFINEIALVTEKVGANINDVSTGIGADHRIGKEFLKAGIGFGGSCLSKDLMAMINLAKGIGVDPLLLSAAHLVNNHQLKVVPQRIHDYFATIKGLKLAVWGLSFKPNTDDCRNSPAVEVVNSLASKGAEISVYDPQVRSFEQCPDLCKSVLWTNDKYQTVNGAQALVILTDWNEFRNINWDLLKESMKSLVIIDGRNIYSPEEVGQKGFSYFGIGARTHSIQPPYN